MKKNLISLIGVIGLTASLMVMALNPDKSDYLELKRVTDYKFEVMDRKFEKIADKIAEFAGDSEKEMKVKYEELVDMQESLKKSLNKAANVTEDRWHSTKDKIEYHTEILEKEIDELIREI